MLYIHVINQPKYEKDLVELGTFKILSTFTHLRFYPPLAINQGWGDLLWGG